MMASIWTERMIGFSSRSTRSPSAIDPEAPRVSFLLDTNILSAHLRRPAGLAHRFFQHAGRLYTFSTFPVSGWRIGSRPEAPGRARVALANGPRGVAGVLERTGRAWRRGTSWLFRSG